MGFDFDEDALNKMVLETVKRPKKAVATPSVFDLVRKRRTAAKSPLRFVPKEIKPPKMRKRSERYPFLEVEV